MSDIQIINDSIKRLKVNGNLVTRVQVNNSDILSYKHFTDGYSNIATNAQFPAVRVTDNGSNGQAYFDGRGCQGTLLSNYLSNKVQMYYTYNSTQPAIYDLLVIGFCDPAQTDPIYSNAISALAIKYWQDKSVQYSIYKNGQLIKSDTASITSIEGCSITASTYDDTKVTFNVLYNILGTDNRQYTFNVDTNLDNLKGFIYYNNLDGVANTRFNFWLESCSQYLANI